MDYKPKSRLSANSYIEGVLKGDRVLLSRAITMIESNLESNKVIAKEIVQAICQNQGIPSELASPAFPA